MTKFVFVFGFVLLFLAVGVLHGRSNPSREAPGLTMARVDALPLHPAPIRPDWILDGHPEAQSTRVGQTGDGTITFVIWRVSAGRFNWFYDFDETISILDGEVFLTEGADAAPGNAAERRLGPGDVILMRNGAAVTWRVPDHVRKAATIRHPLPAVIARLYAFCHAITGLFRRPIVAESL